MINKNDVINKLKEYIRHIDIDIKKEDGIYFIYANYYSANCRIRIEIDYIYNDFDKYLKFVARDIVGAISYEYFYKNELKGSDKE